MTIRQQIAFLATAGFVSFFGWGLLAIGLSPALMIVAFLSWVAFVLPAVLIRCPTCGDPVLRRSVRVFGLHLDYWGPIPPKVCGSCGTSFRRDGSEIHSGPVGPGRSSRMRNLSLSFLSIANLVMAVRFAAEHDYLMAAFSALASIATVILIVALRRA